MRLALNSLAKLGCLESDSALLDPLTSPGDVRTTREEVEKRVADQTSVLSGLRLLGGQSLNATDLG